MDNRETIANKLKFDLRSNTADILADRFRELIMSGELAAGHVFPNENVFCEQLCVSRSTLREAYKALESTGFIRRAKGRGTIVNDFGGISEAAPFRTSIKMSDLDDLMEFREMIESELAKLAAERATDGIIESIRADLEYMKKNVSSIPKMTYYDTKFHMDIAYASGNKLLISTMKNVEAAFSEGMYSAFHVDTAANIEEALTFHANILSAIEGHDSVQAQELMRLHVRSVGRRLGVKAYSGQKSNGAMNEQTCSK